MKKLLALFDLRSLQTRITIGVLLLGLFVLWSAVFALGHTMRRDMETTISRQQFSTVSLIANELDRSIRERQEIVRTIADGYRISRLADSPEAQASLERHPLPESIFNWGLLVIDRQGIAVASIPRQLKRTGVNFLDYPGIKHVLSGAGATITDPLFSEHSQQPIFAIMAPIHDEQKQVVGVVVGVTNLNQSNFLDQIGTTKYGLTGDFLITAPKTRSYVTASDKHRLLKSGPPRGVNAVYDRYIDGYEGSGLALSSRGVLELSSSKEIPSTGWLMQSVLPAAEAFAPIDSVERHLVMVSSGLTLVLAILCWWWLRRQFQPLAEASQLLSQMSSGDVPRQALPVHRNDEIGQLTTAFNGLQEVIIAEEAKAAEHSANKRLRQIVSEVPGVVFQYRLNADGHGSFPFASDAIKELYGVTPEEVRESTDSLRRMVHPDDYHLFIDSLNAAAKNLTPWRHEYRLCMPDGQIKWLLIRAIPEPSTDNSIIFCGFVADITDIKAMESELRNAIAEHTRKDAEIERYRDHLEQLVEERTADLELARADAIRLAMAKSEFLAKMSHEIRTPLHGVLGMTHIALRATEEGSKANDALIKIQHSGKLLLGIINDILDFSKMEAGMLKIEDTPVDLSIVLDETVEMMQERATSKGLEFLLVRADSLPAECRGDALRLRQILLNLLSNAVKFTSSGTVSLEADLDGAHLRFRITDTGIGISPEQMANIFNPFEQGDNSTTRRFGGSGLGLAITDHLVRLMGGTISVDSTPDVGSCFTVLLPYTAVRHHNEVTPETVAASATTQKILSGLRILVAEDVDISRLIMSEILAEVGAEASFAEDGQQAVDAVRTHGAAAYDVVLMDIQMPVMNGFEATRAIHQLAPELPIIGQTAHALAEERDACFAAGMVDHISKPIDPDALFAMILMHARQASGARILS
ncbi:ATP-binding protein [Ferribacterium limneticum]|uniref:ATP-binding protein n=1 Tax=Ferribacterium limneticum TaxID=76259 RepID=UPI001CF892D0|nr:ATP-binding protein [Ferribacterium limneticum]UCV24771.1 response regulator [Ferribacterium limneticum]